MRQGRRKVLLNDQLAAWSAAYLAMWKALESFDPQADRWSEPVDFGGREERIQAAENAIARARQRVEADIERERDIRTFRKHLEQLIVGAPFGHEEAEFTGYVRRAGSSLADRSVVAAGMAGSDR